VAAHHTYPNDQLALVLIELRHPPTDPPARGAMTLMKELLSHWTPIVEQEEGRDINIETGETRPFSYPKLVARDRHTAISFLPDAMTVEVTDYPGWNDFYPIVHATIAARQDVSPVDGCMRVGLRYINEIRAPLEQPSGWAHWVHRSLLGPTTELADLKFKMRAQQHVVQCSGTEPGDLLTLRYAAGRGSIVQSTPALQRLKEAPADGEFFAIDIDSAWSDPQNHIPALECETVKQIAERLHAPIAPLFESLITANLRTQVLDKPLGNM